jgi:methionyl-tRNA formyltransferase
MKRRVVALLGRQHGLSGLQALLHAPQLELVALATHRRLPSSEDPQRSERSEYPLYLALATARRIPLMTVDSSMEQAMLEQALHEIDYDLLVSISWRRLIPFWAIQKAHLAGINLHRGRLPAYPGAVPVQRALLHGDHVITITAHYLDEQIDAGKTICTYDHPVNYHTTETLEENVERLKRELTPHFGPLLLRAIDAVTN